MTLESGATSSRPSVRWEARSFEPGDYERISTLQKAFEADQPSDRRSTEPDYYKWKHSTNPAGVGEIWVAHDREKDVVAGMTTLTPKRLHVNSQDLTGAEIGDTFTHPEYQRQGIFTALVNATREQGVERGINLIYGTPNDQSLPGYEKNCNFVQVPAPVVLNLVRPLNVGRTLKALGKNPLLVQAASAGIRLGLALLYRVRPGGLSCLGVKVVRTTNFPKEIDDLWKRTWGRYDLVLTRDREYLNWRFLTNPDSYQIYVAEGQALMGYLVAKIGRWGPLKVGYVADYLTTAGKDERACFADLLFAAFHDFRQEGCDIVSCWVVGGSPHEGVLRRRGFFKYQPVSIIVYRNEIGRRLAETRHRWHFTMADSDNI